MAFMKKFHSRGRLSKSIGASFIALVPMKSGANSMKDFRPISLLGSTYKILDKELASRLQKILPSVISPSQGAFVHGRLILDGVLVPNECIHSRYLDRIPSLICKLDMEKAFDMVDCKFLHYMMHRMGFGPKWRNWIEECVPSATYSILINGTPKGFFLAQRALR
eukprot:TRINITY_DN52332_c0_g1_i1.p1 TRINITY_DN52332_c0_g1~~TRINITY_DN52332_c0_g1_i1.p1  ORF type:complete len:165 (+),score=14.08 TRINITY_DN52332_c0_g1_i1:155-649(+)